MNSVEFRDTPSPQPCLLACSWCSEVHCSLRSSLILPSFFLFIDVKPASCSNMKVLPAYLCPLLHLSKVFLPTNLLLPNPDLVFTFCKIWTNSDWNQLEWEWDGSLKDGYHTFKRKHMPTTGCIFRFLSSMGRSVERKQSKWKNRVQLGMFPALRYLPEEDWCSQSQQSPGGSDKDSRSWFVEEFIQSN